VLWSYVRILASRFFHSFLQLDTHSKKKDEYRVRTCCDHRVPADCGDDALDHSAALLGTLHFLDFRGHFLRFSVHDSVARDLNKRYPHVLSVRCDYTRRVVQGEHAHVRKWLSNQEVLESALPRLTDQPAPTSPITHIVYTIHRQMHWVLAILDLRNKQFTHLNSLNDGVPDSALAKMELDNLKTHLSLAAGDNKSIPWAPDLFPDIPQQRGGVDCGVFMLAWSTCVGLGVNPAEVKQEHMSNLRERFLLRILLPSEDTFGK
jgi:hypothetical protein